MTSPPAGSAGPVPPPAAPVDRRIARILLGLLVFVGAYQPLSLLLAWLRAGDQVDPDSVLLATANAVLAWACLLAVRRGHLRQAAAVFVAGSLALLAVTYWRWGLAAQAPQQVLHLLPVLVAGLALGRIALWVASLLLVCALLAGAWRDAAAMMFATHAQSLVVDRVLHAVVGVVVLSAVVDAALAALRHSLGTAERRGDALARSRDRLQLEMQEKERSREQLVHAQKLQAVDQLASGVAHDLNHLLGLMLAYARRGQRSEDLAQAHEALQGAESAARRAAAVTRRLLDFSRLEPTRLEVFDAGQALAGMEKMLRQLFRPGVAVVLALPEAPVPVRFDRGQLELIVLTLASNAEHAMRPPAGREADAGVGQAADAAGRFTLALADDGDTVRIAASDTGSGMDAQAQARCFEPFFTTKPVGQGTGLGLPVARTLVETAGGRIEVDSQPGHGTTFRIRLPRPAQGAALADASPHDPRR